MTLCFGFQLYFIKKLTLANNLWQCLEQDEILFFFNETYERAISGRDIPDFVANFEKKLGKIFY